MRLPNIDWLTRPLWWCILCLACGWGGAAHALQISDDQGQRLDFAVPPQRIVSLLPSLTESVCALGHCAQLVGRDRYSNYPATLAQVPVVGGGLDPQIESIVALHPDLVLLSSASRAADRLRVLGIKVLAFEARSTADVQRVLGVLGQLLGVSDAGRVWRAIDAQVLAAKAQVPATARGKRVYFEVNNGPYAAGESSFIGELLGRLGMRNVVPVAMGPFPKLNPEYVVRADPDWIMLADAAAPALSGRPGWQNMAAVQQQRVCVFSPWQADILIRPGPRMGEAAQLMADCLTGRLAQRSGL
jgi:iron complex transport system substrate-binding protein